MQKEFDELKSRGVEDILFISMDVVSGLEEGAKSIYKNVIVQRCIKIYGAPSLKAVEAEFEKFKQVWSEYSGAVDVWVRNWKHIEQ